MYKEIKLFCIVFIQHYLTVNKEKKTKKKKNKPKHYMYMETGTEIVHEAISTYIEMFN